MVESLDLDRNNGCNVSYCCDLLNGKLLIDYYGENIFLPVQEMERNHKCFFQQIFVK